MTFSPWKQVWKPFFFSFLAFGESGNLNLQAEFLLFHLMDPTDFLMPLPLSSLCVLLQFVWSLFMCLCMCERDLLPAFFRLVSMWLYSIYNFIFCTIVNPTVPVAWLCFGYTVSPVHDEESWVCVCECVCAWMWLCVHQTGSVWVCLAATVCAYTQFIFPEHCDNFGITRRLNGRVNDLLSYYNYFSSFFVIIIIVFFFSNFHFVSRTEIWKKRKKWHKKQTKTRCSFLITQ